jgi:hypothetical protein
MKEKIRQWLAEESIPMKGIPDTSAFNYQINYPAGSSMYMHLAQPPDHAYVLIRVVVELASYTPKVRGLQSEKREDLFARLGMNLNVFPTFYRLEISPERILEAIEVSDIVYEDGLSKDRLMLSIRQVYKTVQQAMILMEREFMEVAQKKSYDFDIFQ